MSDQKQFDIPGTHSLTGHNVPEVAAATSTESHPIFTAPVAGSITGVNLTPQVSSTGDNTNTKNLNVVNKGSDGLGSAEIGNLDLVLNTDLTAFDQQAIAVTSTTLAKGDVVALEVEKVGSGVTVGPFGVEILFTPT